MTATIRADAELLGTDVPLAIALGLLFDGDSRRALFSDAAICACHQAEAAGVGPYPLGFLARHVRVGGFEAALALPEPVIGREGTELVRTWLEAAASCRGGLSHEVLFARWLAAVAALLELRRRVR